MCGFTVCTHHVVHSCNYVFIRTLKYNIVNKFLTYVQTYKNFQITYNSTRLIQNTGEKV